MKAHGIALVLAASFAFAVASPSFATTPLENRAVAIGNLMQAWQTRILTSNLPVADPNNWARRNLAKFGRLSDERLALAQSATTLEELELAIIEAPVAEGAPLSVLMANKPGDISMMGARPVTKSSPATSPSSYSGLTFTALTSCRILDSRVSQGGSGAWAAGSSNLIKIGPYATGYQTGAGAQGGSATSCGLDALAGPSQVAVIMAAVSTVSQAGPGYLTFFPNGSTNPGATSVSQWYQAGYVQTSFVLIPTDLSGTVAASGFTSAGTDVIIDIVGYFIDLPGSITTADLANGAVTAAKMASNGCAAGQVLQYNGSAWVCVTAVGPAGPQGPAGAAGAQGPAGPAGAPGATGLVSTVLISGAINAGTTNLTTFIFIGPTVSITTTASQRLTASAMAAIGTTGPNADVQLDFCYQVGAGLLSNFAGGNFSIIGLTTGARNAQAVDATVVPGANTYTVGVCVRTAAGVLNNNDYLNGYVLVTN